MKNFEISRITKQSTIHRSNISTNFIEMRCSLTTLLNIACPSWPKKKNTEGRTQSWILLFGTGFFCNSVTSLHKVGSNVSLSNRISFMFKKPFLTLDLRKYWYKQKDQITLKGLYATHDIHMKVWIWLGYLKTWLEFYVHIF